MKKLFSILAITGFLISCDEAKTDNSVETSNSTSSSGPAADAKVNDSSAMKEAANKIETVEDSTKKSGGTTNKIKETEKKK